VNVVSVLKQHGSFVNAAKGVIYVNLRCSKCKLVFLVNHFDDVRIIQAMSCPEGAGHKLSEVV